MTRFVLLLMIGLTSVNSASLDPKSQALVYLTKYGYLEYSGRVNKYSSEDPFIMAIKDFQRFFGLKETGKLDTETINLMNTPRCGVKDKIEKSADARKKRYAIEGSRWPINDLTYQVSKLPSARLSKSSVEETIERAFKVWSEYIPLTFTKKSGKNVKIDIRFEQGKHGDGADFDRRGGVLAHAFVPKWGGDIHFDDDEIWTVNSNTGTDLFQVAVHEMGHSLGLDHSDVLSSIMFPTYQKIPLVKLHEDDILGIQTIYGIKKKEHPSDGNGNSGGELCFNAAIDAIFTANSRTYVFKGQYYWDILDEGLASGYPRLISTDWKGLPPNIDAAFTWSDSQTFFFKDNEYWRFNEKQMDPGYPKLIKDGFPGIPDKLDAAFQWSGNGKTYFFKGSQYWKYNSGHQPPVSDEYPKKISLWKGIPSNINAAFQWTNHRTYFFKGNNYWRFNDDTFAVEDNVLPFPRSTALWWFGCKLPSRFYMDEGKKYFWQTI